MFDCTIQPVVQPTGCIVYTNIQPGEQLVVQLVGGLTTAVEQPVDCLITRCSQLFNRLFNWFDNRLYRVNGV